MNKLKVYKVRYKIFKAKKKYKAALNKGSNFLILCGVSTREIYNLLFKTINKLTNYHETYNQIESLPSLQSIYKFRQYKLP